MKKTSTDFAPSDVVLGVPPLVGTMGSAKMEYAAALVVRTCQRKGNRWQAVSPKMLGEVIQADISEECEPIFSLNTNPFFRPDFQALADSNFGEWEDKERGPIQLTEAGIAALSRWVPGIDR